MSSSAAERHTLSYNDVEWYPYLTTKKEDTDDDTIYAPSSTLLLSSLIAGAEDDEHYYTTFSSYKEMYEYVDAHKEDVSHPLFEVLTPSRYRKLFVTFQTSSSEVAMEVAKGFSSLLTRFCKDAYSAPEVEEHTRRQQAFSPEDIRIYRNGDVWRVVDAVRMYASARHTSHVQKIIYGELCKIPGVAFANDTAVFYHLPVLTPYLYGKDAEGAYTSFDAELKKETTYRVAPHDYNPWSQSGGGVLTEHYNAAMMRDSYVTSTEKTVKMCTHYCVPPSSVHCDEALVLPYTYFQMCNPDMKAMYRDGAFIRSHHPWFCCMCKEEHPVDYCIEMYYQKNEEQYYYKCDGGNVSSSDEFGSIRGRSISTVTFPLSAEAFEEYMVTGSFPYPHPRMFAADRDVEFLGFGKLVPPGDPGRMGSSGPAWPATNFHKSYRDSFFPFPRGVLPSRPWEAKTRQVSSPAANASLTGDAVVYIPFECIRIFLLHTA